MIVLVNPAWYMKNRQHDRDERQNIDQRDQAAAGATGRAGSADLK